MTKFLEQLGLRIPSPIVPVLLKEFEEKELQVFVKQEGLTHSVYGGNKWRKLKYNLKAFAEGGYESIWTFGGIFSNHIYAIAGLCGALQIPCHGIIRDTRQEGLLSPTLRFAQQQGMELHFVSRTAYRDKEAAFNALSKETTAKIYLIPEGGTNKEALKGVGEIVTEVAEQLEQVPEYWICAAGSGGTAAGLLSRLNAKQHLLVFPALKGNWMTKAILELMEQKPVAGFELINDYHFGGYARYNAELIDFMHNWHERSGIVLDPIYNAKAVFGLMDLVRQNYFPKGSRILLLNSGGWQGIPGFNLRNALQLPLAK